MPVTIQCRKLPLNEGQVEWLWKEVIELSGCFDEVVTIKCVDEQEIRRLNKSYRGKDKSTNVLTFSYNGEHDVALCWEVAILEAELSKKNLKEYFAWLLVHAFLHAVGLDHERSKEEAKRMEKMEAAVLQGRDFEDLC